LSQSKLRWRNFIGYLPTNQTTLNQKKGAIFCGGRAEVRYTLAYTQKRDVLSLFLFLSGKALPVNHVSIRYLYFFRRFACRSKKGNCTPLKNRLLIIPDSNISLGKTREHCSMKTFLFGPIFCTFFFCVHGRPR
jgi:hypothetical protein